MRCDTNFVRPVSSPSKPFQSLLGFLMRCDDIAVVEFGDLYHVSIPAGFSDALRHVEWGLNNGLFPLFQSLLGFLMRCDEIDRYIRHPAFFVSIPAGFSDALRRIFRDVSTILTWFQSLLGFLMRCDVI